MERGDISNEVAARMIVVFNGLVGDIPDRPGVAWQERAFRAARQWRRLAGLYEIYDLDRAMLHDITWRRSIRVDVVMVGETEQVAEAMAQRFDRMNLAVSSVYVVAEIQDLVRSLAYMPEVLWVVHGNEAWKLAFGPRGRLGFGGL